MKLIDRLQMVEAPPTDGTGGKLNRSKSNALSRRAIRAKVKTEMQQTYGTSWFCEPCKGEVYDRSCRHCGKTRSERA